jgi:hypothetical protein
MRVVVPLLLAAVAGSAEVARRDLLLAVEQVDGGFTYELRSPVGSFTGEDAFERMTFLRLGGRWAWASAGGAIAPLIGGDLVLCDATLPGGGLSATGAEMCAGATWAITPRWSLDGEALLGAHLATLSLPGGAGADLEADGVLLHSGLRLRLLGNLTRHWSLGGEGGWRTWGGDLTSSDGREASLSGTGFSIGVVLAWRPSARPGSLE